MLRVPGAHFSLFTRYLLLIVCAYEKLTVFLELESAIRAYGELN